MQVLITCHGSVFLFHFYILLTIKMDSLIFWTKIRVHYDIYENFDNIISNL